jgi:geranylgeranyl pyrophosphate synthase
VALAESARSDTAVIAEMVRLIRESDAIAQARAEAESFARQAIADLALFPPSPHRQALVDMAEYVVARPL